MGSKPLYEYDLMPIIDSHHQPVVVPVTGVQIHLVKPCVTVASISPANRRSRHGQTDFLPRDSWSGGAEAFAPARVIHCGYATHFIVSLLRFLAQSSKYKSISFW